MSNQYNEKSSYEKWLEKENAPVFSGYSIPNLKEIKVEPWDKIGGSAMFVQLEGTADTNNAYVYEIPGGKNLKVERHLYEEVVYVVKGRGATSVWYDENKKRTFEWKEGSLFVVPPNTWHQHYNGQGNETARLYGVTSAPLLINLFHNEDFVFNNDFIFTDRFNADENFFSGEGISAPGRIWDTNFIADVRDFPLIEWKERGAGGNNIYFELGDNSLIAHVSEFPVGTYKKGHKHGPGAHVIIVKGHGYSLLWHEGEARKKVDWQEGSVLVPADQEFHQHFNTGGAPARYLAIRWGSMKHPLFKSWGITKVDKSLKQGGNQIEYEDEDREIREIFEAELAKNGVECKMPRVNK